MFTRRRIINGILTLAGLALVTWLLAMQQRQLGRTSFSTGYLLFGMVLVLAGYNLRKKLPQLPLGSSATWMQIHIYIGLATGFVFFLHVGPHWPQGILDNVLAAVFLLTFASGLYGLYITRTIPAQLARVGEEIIYERIPGFRRELREQARSLALESVSISGTTTVADFYSEKLYQFFEHPRSWSYALRPTTSIRRALLNEMQDLRRYLSEAEKKLFEKFFALVRRKDDLDFHAARQGLLKSWLFVHIALTYMLLPLALLHGVITHVYWGGAL